MGIFEKAIIYGESMLLYIPQRPPMVMVDSYFGKQGQSSYVGFSPNSCNIFCKDGYFQECGIIEHIAQSAAVSVGVEFTEKAEDVPIGYIGAVSKFNLIRLPKIGEKLCTTITTIQSFQDISLIYAEVSIEDNIVATGELKIFLQSKNGNDQ